MNNISDGVEKSNPLEFQRFHGRSEIFNDRRSKIHLSSQRTSEVFQQASSTSTSSDASSIQAWVSAIPSKGRVWVQPTLNISTMKESESEVKKINQSHIESFSDSSLTSKQSLSSSLSKGDFDQQNLRAERLKQQLLEQTKSMPLSSSNETKKEDRIPTETSEQRMELNSSFVGNKEIKADLEKSSNLTINEKLSLKEAMNQAKIPEAEIEALFSEKIKKYKFSNQQIAKGMSCFQKEFMPLFNLVCLRNKVEDELIKKKLEVSPEKFLLQEKFDHLKEKITKDKKVFRKKVQSIKKKYVHISTAFMSTCYSSVVEYLKKNDLDKEQKNSLENLKELIVYLGGETCIGQTPELKNLFISMKSDFENEIKHKNEIYKKIKKFLDPLKLVTDPKTSKITDPNVAQFVVELFLHIEDEKL